MESKIIKILKLVLINTFTIIRLIGAFMLPFIYHKYGANICALWTIALFLTDAIDGFLARTFHASTFFGCSMDALSDKILNTVSFILLSLSYSIMIPPLILEICILLTIYSTYRHGGNVQSSKIGKIKTVILDICVIGSFMLLGIQAFNIDLSVIKYINSNCTYYITILGCICTIFELIALLDYKKRNLATRNDPKNIKVKYLNRTKKSFNEIMHDAFDTKYYLKHKDEAIMAQFFNNN